ncbi:hypothetical protein QQF64_031405, partial [Cirrhinus molitorella]
WLEDPSSLPPASESRTPPRPFDPSAPPWLLAPSSPPWPPASESRRLPRPSAPPWSVVDHPPPRTPLLRLRLVLHPSTLSSSSFPPLLLSPGSLRLHRGLLDPRLRIGRRCHLFHLGPPDPPSAACPIGPLPLSPVGLHPTCSAQPSLLAVPYPY